MVLDSPRDRTPPAINFYSVLPSSILQQSQSHDVDISESKATAPIQVDNEVRQ